MVTAARDDTIIGQATVYLKAGTLTNPTLSLMVYDQMQRSDRTCRVTIFCMQQAKPIGES